MWNDLFNTIAPVYGLFFDYQVKNFRKVLDTANGHFDIPAGTSFLDIGCGTGALSHALLEHGYHVTGVDAAPQMINQAQERNTGNFKNYVVGDVLKGLPFADSSFDVVIASYVAHGMKEADRKVLYTEASRLAKNMIVFHDYNKKRSIGSDFIEWLEGGDYFRFIKIVESELKEALGNVEVLDVARKSALYIIKK